jgi:hypothetical protein
MHGGRETQYVSLLFRTGCSRRCRRWRWGRSRGLRFRCSDKTRQTSGPDGDTLGVLLVLLPAGVGFASAAGR